jgi:hypothetical protein
VDDAGFFKLLGAIGRGLMLPPPRLALDEFDGGIGRFDKVLISTVKTYDMGYETAVCVTVGDDYDAYPVERYASEEDALSGHARWVEKFPALNSFTCLGYGGLVDPREISVLGELDDQEDE